jgi:hypothetical protein
MNVGIQQAEKKTMRSIVKSKTAKPSRFARPSGFWRSPE